MVKVQDCLESLQTIGQRFSASPKDPSFYSSRWSFAAAVSAQADKLEMNQ
jgi:hypothetical protein